MKIKKKKPMHAPSQTKQKTKKIHPIHYVSPINNNHKQKLPPEPASQPQCKVTKKGMSNMLNLSDDRKEKKRERRG